MDLLRAQVRAWLDEAQEELLETQAALQAREAECRRVSAQLEAMQAGAGAQVGCHSSDRSSTGAGSDHLCWKTARRAPLLACSCNCTSCLPPRVAGRLSNTAVYCSFCPPGRPSPPKVPHCWPRTRSWLLSSRA